jgi:hypothetical protein
MPKLIHSNVRQLAQALSFVRKRRKEARRAAAKAQLKSSVRNTEPTLRDYTKDQGRDDTLIGTGGRP